LFAATLARGKRPPSTHPGFFKVRPPNIMRRGIPLLAIPPSARERELFSHPGWLAFFRRFE